jgi:uncharacterized protein YkwD
MKNLKITTFPVLRLSALATALALTGCGGGGSSTPSGSNTGTGGTGTTCGTSQVLINGVCTMPADLQTSVPTPPFPAGSEELKSFNYLNDFRKSLGLGLLAYSPELTLSAANHANYLKINQVGGFDEDPLKPGFTGKTLSDRANFAGYKTNQFISGGLALANTSSGAIQALINTIYHRSILIDQSVRDVGSATYCFTCDGSVALNIILARKDTIGQRNASDFAMFYPVNKQTNVNLTMAGETTNPFPEYPDGLVYGKVGYPISFALEASQTLNLKDFTLTEAGSTMPLNAYVYTALNDPQKFIPKNEAWITAKAQLKPSTTYTAVLHGSVNGQDFSCVVENGNLKIVVGKSDGCTTSFTTADRLLPSF